MSEDVVEAVGSKFDANASFTPFGGSQDANPALAQSRDEQMFDLLQLGPTSVIAGMADTMGNSLGILDDGELEEVLKRELPALGTYYSRNKVPAQTLGDLTGMFIPGLAVLKAYQGAGRAARMINGGRKSKLLDTIFTRAGRYQQELNAVKMRDRFLTGATNPNRRNLNPEADTYRQLFARRAISTRVSDIIKDNLAFEAGVGIFMNSSDFLFPDEFGVLGNAALIAALPGTVAIGSGLAVRRQLRASLQTVKVKNIAGLALDEIVNRPGTRDLGITMQATARAEAAKIYADAAAKGQSVTIGGKPVSFGTIQSNANSEVLIYDSSIKQQVEALFKDNFIDELAKAQQASKGQFSKEVETVMDTLRNDESALLGAFSLESIPDTREGLVSVLTRRDEAVKQLRSKVINANNTLQKVRQNAFGTAGDEAFDNALVDLEAARLKLDEVSAAEFYVLETDGALVDVRLRKPIYQDGDIKIITEPATTIEQKAFRLTVDNTEIGLTQDFQLLFPGGDVKTPLAERWGALSLKEQTASFALIQRAIKNYKPGKFDISIAATDHFTRLDAILELNRTTNGKIFEDIQLPKEFQNIDDIEFASLSSKYSEYIQLRERQNAARAGTINLTDAQRLNEEDVRKMLNLPGTGIGGKMHPLQEVFETFFQAGNPTLKDAVDTLNHLERQIQETAFFPRLTSFEPNNVKLQGNMLNIPDSKKPVVVMKRPVHDEHYSRKYLQEAVSHERMEVLSKMATSNENGAGLVQLVSDTLTSLEDMVRSASNVESLIQGQQRGTGLVASQAFAAGEMPVMIAAHNLNLNVTKAFRKASGAEFAKFHPVFNKIKNPANKGDMLSFNLYAHARRQGWEVDNPTAGDGLIFFPLRDTKRNRDRFERIYGRSMPEEDAMMPSAGTAQRGRFIEYQPLGVTPLAAETGTAIADLGQTLLRNNNKLKTLAGRGELRQREFWVPPRNFSNGNVAFVMSPTGELISVAHGRNLADAKRLAEAEVAARGEGTFAVSSADVGVYKDLEDEAFERMMDFTDPLKQTAGITGKQVGQFVDTGEAVLTDMIKGLERQFDSTLKRSLSTYFEPQIAYARQRRNIANIPAAETATDIYSTYIRQLLGNNALNPNELIGRSFLTMEWAYDSVLNKLFDKHAAFFAPAGVQKVQANRKENKFYQALEGKLGEHNPFESALDFANKTHNVQKPLFLTSAKDHAVRLNQLTSLLTLRLFEVGHSVLTLTSLGATIPGVVAAMKKTDLEAGLGVAGHEQYLARIGAFGTDAGDVAIFSPTKAITTAIHDGFSKEGREVWKRANELGYMDQQVSEIFRTLTAPAEGYMEGIYRRSTNIASVLSDNAEILARGLSFMTGHSIAQRGLGLKNEHARFAFAHHFANNVIGDYAPNNRPRIFQGAAGMPMGLFMTFMWNYYQRIFGYVENAQTRALVTQFATQASVFGAQTVPGFNQYSDMFFSNWDGTVNPVDSLNARFGPEASEWFLNGVLSNIPKMFGSDDGVALYTRGDVNFRNIPTIFTIGDLPAASMISNFFGAARETFGMLRQRGGVDLQQLSEIAQTYSTNRSLKNIASLYSGNITDRRGQVISSDTPSFGDLVRGDVVNGVALTARLMGMRTLNEANRVEAHARVRSTDVSRRYRMGELRDAVRSEFRKGKPDPEFINQAIGNYIKQGGSPDYIPNWLMQQFMTSRVDKTSLRLMQIIANPNKADEVTRLLSAMSERSPAITELGR